jgi:hypothetical protein
MRSVFHIEVIFKIQKQLPTYHAYYGNWTKLFDDNIEYFPMSKDWYRDEKKKFPLTVLDNHDFLVTVRKGEI